MKSENPGMTAAQLLVILNARKLADRFTFYDEFNRTADDTDVWTSGGDAAGDFRPSTRASQASEWTIITGGVIDDDYYAYGVGIKNKSFTPGEIGYTTVTWETRLGFQSIANISAFWGLIDIPITGYEEPNTDCAHFFADPIITNTFRCRTGPAAEEETDSLIALDTAPHIFKIVWTTTSVLFYIDGALVATHATQVPNEQLLTEFLIRTEAAAVKDMLIDYVRVELS